MRSSKHAVVRVCSRDGGRSCESVGVELDSAPFVRRLDTRPCGVGTWANASGTERRPMAVHCTLLLRLPREGRTPVSDAEMSQSPAVANWCKSLHGTRVKGGRNWSVPRPPPGLVEALASAAQGDCCWSTGPEPRCDRLFIDARTCLLKSASSPSSSPISLQAPLLLPREEGRELRTGLTRLRPAACRDRGAAWRNSAAD
mmetsp:Transcript_101727/g.286847  ORF Transcript_101727/g.286847 Transcript_101727/m.286847 type:complete len:200 (-) Transcript_101727:88-687(-)